MDGDPGRATQQHHRHGVGGVRGVRAAGRGVAHHLAIAVVRRGEQGAAHVLQRRDDAPEAGARGRLVRGRGED